jgi:hypothetical protein
MGVAKLSEEDKRFLLSEHLLNVGYDESIAASGRLLS